MDSDNLYLIDRLILSVSDEQLSILEYVWDYFLEKKEWPPGKIVRKKYGRETVNGFVTGFKAIFILHCNSIPTEDSYKLTTEGIYALEGADGVYMKLLLQYLDYLKQRFNEDLNFKQVVAKDIQEHFKLREEDMVVLGWIISMGNVRVWGVSFSGEGSFDWTAGVMQNIEILDEAKSSLDFLRGQWSEHILKQIGKNFNI